jgi:predicted Zn-dependent protease
MLLNVVDEMALASGVPVPDVYVLEQEDGINAFAAGHTPSNAAVAVTRGALLKLNRDQLQGVIAHEFSHVLNGDIRISVRLMGLVFGLMAVALAGRLLMRLAGHGHRRAAPVLMMGLGIAVIGQIGFWGGRVLQAWISRKRECLADASAVQFTRNPDGLRDALIRAAALTGPSHPANPAMEQMAHMLFVSAMPRMLATHPPLLQRLRELDPNMNQARLDSMIRRAQAQWRESGAAAAEPETAAPAPSAGVVPAAAQRIAAMTGVPGPQHLAFAVALRQSLPETLRVGTEAPDKAQALLLALVSSGNAALREMQLELVGKKFGRVLKDAVRELAPAADALPALQRLPAVLQLFPALRALPDAERQTLAGLLREMVHTDGSISVFEYSLEKLASRALLPQTASLAPHGNLSIEARSEQLGIVFSVLAAQGASDADQARYAYEAGIAPLLPRMRPGYAVIEDWVGVFDRALDDLRGLQIMGKQMLIEGLVRTIAHDDCLTPQEAELLRAICGVLECPLPPILPAA